MKVCYLQLGRPKPCLRQGSSPPPGLDPSPRPTRPDESLGPEPIDSGWARALGAARLDLEAFRQELAAAAARGEPLSYEVVWIEPTSDGLPEVTVVARLLASHPSCKLVLYVAELLPAAQVDFAPWRTALELADLVLTPTHRARQEVRRRTSARAHELLPPGRDDVAGWAAGDGLRAAHEPAPLSPPGTSALRATPRRARTLTVVSAAPSELRLLREIGFLAYASTRLGGRLCWLDPEAPDAERERVLGQSEIVYLPVAVDDGGALALDCARLGAILIAPLDYDAGRVSFPYTSFDDSQRGRRGLLLLWLYTSAEFRQFFREIARHGARWLADENRRVQLARRLEYQFPEQHFPLLEGGAPSLLDQIRHRHGALDVPCEANECLLVCLVRNGEEHLPAFLEHYRRLGVRHFFFVDNGSDDATLALLESEPDVTTYATALPHKHYEREIRRLVIERHCRGCWCLNVDVDELFDYPHSGELGLVGLLAYLSQRRATAMAGYLLDMYAKENSFGGSGALDLRSAYPFYDISNIQRARYHTHQIKAFCDRNVLADPGIECYFGGIRKTLFGSRTGEDYLLTKHPLIFLDGELEPVTHPHYSNGARVADVTCVLYHYKFTPSFKAKVEESRASKRYVKFAQGQYDQYQKQIGARASLVIDTPGTQRLADVSELVEQGFLRTSPEFEAYVRNAARGEGQKRGSRGESARVESSGAAPARQGPTAVTVSAIASLVVMVLLAVGAGTGEAVGTPPSAASPPAPSLPGSALPPVATRLLAVLVDLGDASSSLFGLLALLVFGSAAIYLLEGLARRKRLLAFGVAASLIAAALTPLGASVVAFACGWVAVTNAFVYFYLASIALWRDRHPLQGARRPASTQRPSSTLHAPSTPRVDPSLLPEVAVIIPARDEASVIEATLLALDALDYPAERLELVVIDDGSSDATRARVRAASACMSHPVRLIHFERCAGKARRINQLLPALSAEYVLLLDADHIVAPDLVRRMLPRFAEGSDVAGVQAASAVRNGHVNVLSRALEMEYLFRCQGTYPGKPMGIFVGSGGMFRRSDLLGVGGFDPEMLTEDVELSYRLYAAGKRIVYDASVCTHDLAMTDYGNFFNQRYRWMRGLWQAMLRHLPRAEAGGGLRRVATYFIQCTSDGLVALCLSVLFMYVFLEQLGVGGVQPRLPAYLTMLACSYAFGVGFVRARRPGLLACMPLVPLYSVLHAIPMAWALIDAYVLGKPIVWVKTDRSLLGAGGPVRLSRGRA